VDRLMATPTYNNSGAGSNLTPATTVTLAFAANAGSNRLLEVWVGSGSGTPTQPTGVTWGGQAMTIRGTGVTAAFCSFVKYYIKEADFPGGATGTIVATWAAAKDERWILAMCHSDVLQAAPYRGASQTSEDDGDVTAPSIAIASDAADIATAGICVADDNDAELLTLGITTGTERGTVGVLNGYEGSSSASVAGASTATITWAVTRTTNVIATLMLGDSLQGAAAEGGSITLMGQAVM
jgi:hypothetical protein